MNRLTAIFLQQLYDYVPQKNELLQRAKKELLRQLDISMPEAVSPGTLFFSEHAQQFKGKMDAWKNKVQNLCRIEHVREFLSELEMLCARQKELHNETQRQIHSAGLVDVSKLHLFYRSEQKQALDVVNEMVRIELFRVVALAGPDRFCRIPPIDTVPDTLAGYLGYWKQWIDPALQNLPDHLLYGCWAFQEQECCPTGPLGKLPTYLPVKTNKKSGTLLPGEWARNIGPRGNWYQGVGRLTNLTPDTVQWAQHQNIKQHIPVTELASRMHLLNPVQAMQAYFGQTPYSVDPYELFSTADLAATANTMLERGQTHSCFLCGGPVQDNAPLCARCVERTYIK